MARRDPYLSLPFPDVVAPARPTYVEEPAPPRRPAEPVVISVAELDRRLKRIVESGTDDVRVEGEVSGLRAVASGHAYFTLKDEAEDASIDCVMYRTAPVRAKKLLAEGARLVLAGRATVYAPRGRLQFIADDARQAGRGALLEALERLKEKLAAEGLFAAARKRPLPTDPAVIGVVTSGDGAAIHDIVTVAFRRGGVRVVLARSPVQGAGAALLMTKAFVMLQKMPEIEAIIVGRGGGSADDLSVYNDEMLVRQVAACRVPVVSAVGHETDTTLIDLAADARAATPSQAAEMLVADTIARKRTIDHLELSLVRAFKSRLAAARAAVSLGRTRLLAGQRILGERQQKLDEDTARLRAQAARLFVGRRAELARLERRLAARHPTAVLAGARSTLGPLEVRLASAMRRRLAALQRAVQGDAGRIDAMSPLAVLARGYAIAEGPGGRAIRDPAEVRAGDLVRLRVHRGTLPVRVVEPTPPEGDPNA